MTQNITPKNWSILRSIIILITLWVIVTGDTALKLSYQMSELWMYILYGVGHLIRFILGVL